MSGATADESVGVENTLAAAPAMVAMSLREFQALMPDCDIYIRPAENGLLKLYRKQSQPLDRADLERLASRGIQQLYISHATHEAERQRRVSELKRDTSLPPTERYHLMRELNRAGFEAAYHGGELSRIVATVSELGEHLVDALTDSDLVLTELHSLMDHDDSTYSHSVNVATYAMLLAKYLGVEARSELCAVIVGGLLHDLGKRYVDLQILNKPGRLTDEEREHMQQHPVLGFRQLLHRDDLTWAQLMMVYQHHERFAGNGYPVGVPAAEIDYLARVTTVADVFHALTSIRPYRTPMSTDEACRYLAGQSGKLLDPDMTSCWICNLKT